MAIKARDLVVSGMDFVGESNRLFWPIALMDAEPRKFPSADSTRKRNADYNHK